MFFRSSGLLASVLALICSSVFASASNEDDRISILDYFLEPSAFEDFFSVVTPNLRTKADAGDYVTCRPHFKTTPPSIEAARELKKLRLMEMETQTVDFSKAPAFLDETEADCISVGGQTFYYTATSTCMQEVYHNFNHLFEDFLIDVPVCLVGSCSAGKTEISIRTLPACHDAEVTDEAPDVDPDEDPDEDHHHEPDDEPYDHHHHEPDVEPDTECHYYEFSGRFSREALRQLYYVKEEAVREGIANAQDAPLTMQYIQEDCMEKEGYTHYITSTLGCLDNFDHTGYFSPDPDDPDTHARVVVEDFPICLVGYCPDAYVVEYVRSSFPQCDYARVKDEIDDNLAHLSKTE